MKKFYLLVLWGISFAAMANGQVILSNTIQGSAISSEFPYTGGVQVEDPNGLYNVIELGPGIIWGTADNTYIGSNWNTGNNIDVDNYYFEFSLAASQPEYVLRFVSFVYSAQVSADGPSSFAFRSSLDGFGSNIGVFIADNNPHTINLNIPAYQGLTDIVFRVYGWNATDVAGTFSINDFAFNGTVTSTYSLTTGTVSTPPFNVTCVAGANGTVGFTAVGPYPGGGNVYTVQLSDAAGLFTSPTNIGSLTSDNLSGTIPFTIPAATGASSSYRIRVVSSEPAITGTQSAAFTVNSATCATTLATDYFRSRLLSGNWSVPNNWESAHAAGGPWFTATLAPGGTASSILVQTGHTMVINTNETINNAQVSGLLQLLNNNGSNAGIVTLASNPTDELTINNGGTFQIISSGPSYTAGGFFYGASSNVKVLTGGKILIGDGSAAHTTGGFERFGIEPLTKVYWGNGSILEWNTSGVTIVTGNSVYFPGTLAAEVPTLRLTLTNGVQLGANTITTINGLLEVNTPTSFGLIGLKTFRNGITGSAVTLTLNVATNGYTISGADGGGNPSPAIIGGSLTIVLNEHLRLSRGVTVPVGAGVNITTVNKQIQKATGSLLVNGSLDLNTVPVTNVSGDVTVNGTLKTGSLFGLYGPGASVLSGTLNLNQTTSTIEYKAAGPQAVQGATLLQLYHNLIISGSGVKTLASANAMTPNGTLTITGNAVFDAGIHTIGNPTSDLVMSGTSQFRIAGGGTKPDPGGSYIIFPNTLIEFYGSSATTIRLGAPTNYASIIVSGTNVSNPSAGTGLRFGTGGFFTVKSGATFHLNSTAGLSGAVNSAISNTNNPTVTLENNSSIDYNGAAQAITTAPTTDYGNLTLSGSGIKTAPAALTLTGNFLNSTTTSFAHNNGTVTFSGAAAQSIYSTGASPLVFYSLVNNNSTGLSVDTTFHIANLLSLSPNSKLNVFDSIVLLSNLTNTARVDKIPASATINYTTGRFIVERYIPLHSKAWQLLATPLLKEQTIKAAWQEGNTPLANNKPGYGTIITSNIPGNGFDILTPPGPTIKTYNPITGLWDGVASTINDSIANPKGYMLFVRGDRSVQTAVGPASAPTATTLRITGKIYDSTFLPAPVTIPGGTFATVGNPFASPIDLTRLNRSNPADIPDMYYVWDPKLTTGGGSAYGLGGFRTLVRSGADYIVTPPGGSYPTNTKYIQSGQAFFVRSASTGGTITFDEDDKASVTAMVNRGPLDDLPQQLATDLYVTTGGTSVLIDGVLAQFDPSYSSAIDHLDAVKLNNSGENLGILRGENIVVERRAPVVSNDTIFYNLGQLRQQHYQLKFAPQNMAGDIQGYLVDRFLNTRTEISMQDTSAIDFAITADPLSAAPNRFFLVFKPHTNVNTIIGIAAEYNPAQTGVSVKWNVAGEKYILQYEVERSADGVRFTSIDTRTPANNNGSNSSYQFTDDEPLRGVGYYRIKAIMNGGNLYSEIVKLSPARYSGMTITPNPVVGKMLNIRFDNTEPGDYRISVINASGQEVYAASVRIQGNERDKIFALGNTAAGVYHVQLKGAGNIVVQKIIIQ